jgi:hypothetical protein
MDDVRDRFPIRVARRDDVWTVDWCRLGGERFTDPFFEETVRRCVQRPFNLAFRTLTPLDELSESPPGALRPDGLIFHLSRCGSTLIAQALAALPEHLVLSEPAPIDDVVRSPLHDASVSDERRVRWLRAVAGALGRRYYGDERRFVLKLDSWHVYDLALFERAFPGVPWVFVYRDPLEIVVSHARQFAWGMSAANAPAMMGMSVAEAAVVPRIEYVARAVGRMCDALLAHGVSSGALVHYRELPGAIWERIAPRFGLGVDERAVAAMRAATERNSKDPGRTFSSDREAKLLSATDEMRAATARWAQEPYERLEALARSL